MRRVGGVLGAGVGVIGVEDPALRRSHNVIRPRGRVTSLIGTNYWSNPHDGQTS